MVCLLAGGVAREGGDLASQKSGAKVRAGGFSKSSRIISYKRNKYTLSQPHDIITMKRKLNDQDVPEVSEAVTDAETEGEEQVKQVEKVEKKTPTAKTFAELGLDARLLQAINKEKFAAPTPVQARAIPLALSGKDILGNPPLPLSLKLQD
jgi:hypothetical protein